jgi:hypothetical protein
MPNRYYAAECGINPNSIVNVADISELPIKFERSSGGSITAGGINANNVRRDDEQRKSGLA